MTWGLIWRITIPILVVSWLVVFVSLGQWDKVWRLAVQTAFFYMLWLGLQYLRRIFDQGREAFKRLDESHVARMAALEDLSVRFQRQEERSAQIAVALAERQAELADGVAVNTDIVSKHVTQTLEAINKKLDDNMDATVKAAEASAEAAVVSNHVNEKIATTNKAIVSTRDDLVNKLEELFKTAKPRKRDA